jgi:hypothetical protein
MQPQREAVSIFSPLGAPAFAPLITADRSAPAPHSPRCSILKRNSKLLAIKISWSLILAVVNGEQWPISKLGEHDKNII